MKWGLKINVNRNEQKEITLAEYCEYINAEYPDQPEIPECAGHVWHWWWELNARRLPGFESMAPLSYTEICSWLMLTRNRVTPEEINWLLQMDNAYIIAIAEQRDARREREQDESERRKS